MRVVDLCALVFRVAGIVIGVRVLAQLASWPAAIANAPGDVVDWAALLPGAINLGLQLLGGGFLMFKGDIVAKWLIGPESGERRVDFTRPGPEWYAFVFYALGVYLLVTRGLFLMAFFIYRLQEVIHYGLTPENLAFYGPSVVMLLIALFLIRRAPVLGSRIYEWHHGGAPAEIDVDVAAEVSKP